MFAVGIEVIKLLCVAVAVIVVCWIAHCFMLIGGPIVFGPVLAVSCKVCIRCSCGVSPMLAFCSGYCSA